MVSTPWAKPHVRTHITHCSPHVTLLTASTIHKVHRFGIGRLAEPQSVLLAGVSIPRSFLSTSTCCNYRLQSLNFQHLFSDIQAFIKFFRSKLHVPCVSNPRAVIEWVFPRHLLVRSPYQRLSMMFWLTHALTSYQYSVCWGKKSDLEPQDSRIRVLSNPFAFLRLFLG